MITLPQGRMISHSKSGYRRLHPYNPQVYFNANIFIQKDGKPEKIWWGDLDLAVDGLYLKTVAEANEVTLYVLPEFEGRIDNPTLASAVWDTTKEVIEVTPEYIEKEKARRAENLRLSRIASIGKLRKEIALNRTFKEKVLDYHKTVHIPFGLLMEKFYEVIKNKDISFRKTHGYFTAYFLDEFLKKELNAGAFDIHPSAIWLGRKLNKKLRKIDYIVEKNFNQDFKYSDFGRYVTCNYCVEDIYYANKEGLNLNSYDETLLYIKKDYLKEQFN